MTEVTVDSLDQLTELFPDDALTSSIRAFVLMLNTAQPNDQIAFSREAAEGHLKLLTLIREKHPNKEYVVPPEPAQEIPDETESEAAEIPSEGGQPTPGDGAPVSEEETPTEPAQAQDITVPVEGVSGEGAGGIG